MHDTYETPLNSRYASREMQKIFSPDRKFTTWRKLWVVAIASAVTVATHLFAGRRALLSIFAGTTVYIVLLNFF